MAITSVNKLSEHSATSGTSFTTSGSVTPAANKLYLITANARVSTGSVNPPEPTITAFGLTWVLVNKTDYDASGADRQSAHVFRSMGGSPSSGTIQANYGSFTCNVFEIVCDEVSGVDTSGTNGSGAIVQSNFVVTASGVFSADVTLNAFADATNNAAYGMITHASTNSEAHTVDASGGYSALANTAVTLTATLTEYKVGQDLTVSGSWVTGSRGGGVAIELKAASTGTSAPAGATAGSGVAPQPTPSDAPNAGTTAGTGVAQTPTAKDSVNTNAVASSGVAPQPTDVISSNANLASGSGVSQQPTEIIAASADSTSGTGVAPQPTVVTGGSTNAPAGLAIGNGDTATASSLIQAKAGVANGDSAALSVLFSTPTGLQAVAVSVSEIDVSWNPVAWAAGYDVERDSEASPVFVAAPATSYQHTGLSPGTEHF